MLSRASLRVIAMALSIAHPVVPVGDLANPIPGKNQDSQQDGEKCYRPGEFIVHQGHRAARKRMTRKTAKMSQNHPLRSEWGANTQSRTI